MSMLAEEEGAMTLAEVAQLWELASVLAAHDMIPQAITSLEAVCGVDATKLGAAAQQIVFHANVLLAEICVVTSPSETNRIDRKLWRKRLARAARCIHIVEQALQAQSDAITHEWHYRLFKTKYLLMELSKTERAVKNRQILEILCAAITFCVRCTEETEEEVASSAVFKEYFLGKLRAHLVKLHAASLLAKYPENGEHQSGFLQNLQFVQRSVPDQFDTTFQLWLVEISCHAYATSFYFEGGNEALSRIKAADDFFKNIATHTNASREMRVHQLVISGFYFLRTGEVKKITPLLDDINVLLNAPDTKPTGILQEPYLNSVIDGLKLHVMSCSDPCEALAFSMKAIHQVQTNMQTYAANKSIQLMLIATLFDMLYLHCRLQGQQCRYFEFGLSIAQMLQLFATNKATLESTIFYKLFVARCHILIAKYAVAIGKVKDTVFNINYVIEKLLPPIGTTTTSYPDAYLSVWIEALQVLTYCGSAADPSFATPSPSESSAPQIRQFCPNVVLLEFGARILEMDGLRNLIYNGCSVELRAKYDLALAKWLWGSQELVANPVNAGNNIDLGRHVALENLRPSLLTILHESLERMGNHVSCSETIAELMTLFGPKLIEFGKFENGEETLKNAVRISLHAKNLLLQSRLLVDIFRLYKSKQLIEAQATTAEKYEKKFKLLQKRIAQAQAETARNKLILRWKGGEPSKAEVGSSSKGTAALASAPAVCFATCCMGTESARIAWATVDPAASDCFKQATATNHVHSRSLSERRVHLTSINTTETYHEAQLVLEGDREVADDQVADALERAKQFSLHRGHGSLLACCFSLSSQANKHQKAMRAKRRLWVEVVGARNLESRQSLDAYCVVQIVGGERLTKNAAATAGSGTEKDTRNGSLLLASRSTSVQSSGSGVAWSHALELDLEASLANQSGNGGGNTADDDDEATPRDTRVVVQIFNEKNFFFDMFPASGSSLSGGRKSSMSASSCSESNEVDTDEGTSPADSAPPCETDSEDEEGLECSREPEQKATWVHQPTGNCTGESSPAAITTKKPSSQEVLEGADEPLGFLELNISQFCKPSRIATDAWYLLRGTRSGEVRIRTLCTDDKILSGAMDDDMDTAAAAVARETMFKEHIYGRDMRDHYGFKISDRVREEWAHLRSYEDCREERRVSDWELAFGAHFFSVYRGDAAKENSVVRQLARAGIPRSWRERVYMDVSGAREKQQNAGVEYYKSLVEQSETTDSLAFRQIELDIDRTFGHSGTKICTEAGRSMLRRVLRVYSIRNPSVGYCQGLNFIVGFLTLAVEEEAAFWLLAVICEDLYPGYYTPTMAETQTDMLVLKELIADELPRLDAFTAEVGLPLELLGSQWLLCLFTTTFPSETVFRIFDCIFTEGSDFVFPVIIAHLRRLERTLIGLEDFQAVLSSMKNAENALLDADSFMADAAQEADRIEEDRILALRVRHRESVRDEMQRAARARALNRQLAVMYQVPAFSTYAANLLRFFHEEAEVSSRSDVAFILTLLCHGLVWLAEHSKRWQR